MKYFIGFTLVLGLVSMMGCKHDHQHGDHQNNETGDHEHLHQHKHAHDHAHHDGHGHGDHHGHGHANEHMNKTSFEELVQRFESDERNAYQQPEKVMKFLAPWDGKKVLDIGSGTGYFSFRMVDAGATVWAGDVDERFQEYIKNKRDSLGISPDRLHLKKLPYDSPELEAQSVDRVLIVNTYHHIEGRIPYMQQILNGLTDGGELVIIDFKKQDDPVGPPVSMKMAASTIEAELEGAGFVDIEINGDLLPYQYIIRAK